MVARTLLIATALVEMPVGVMLLASPRLVDGLILGAPFDAPAAVILGRIGGAALLALSAACWLARDDGPNLAQRGLIAAMLLYNCAAGAVLVDAAARLRFGGVVWLAVAVHVFLAVWCAASLRRGR